jgi:hypothetical protein
MPWLPEVAFEPLHAPPAVHDVVLVDDQLSCVLPPDITFDGLAARLTVGTGGGADITITVAERLIDPPTPVHCSV